MDELAIVAAFKQGNHGDAVRLLPPDHIQNRQIAFTKFTTEFKSLYPHSAGGPSNNVTLLHIAAFHGWLDFIKVASAFNCRDNRGFVPLHYAAAGNSVSVVDYLITEQGCDPTTPDNSGAISLHIACLNGHLDIIKYFIALKKCDPNSRGQYGFTPLHYTCVGGHMNITQYLITEIGCDPNTPNNNGTLPLHIACRNGHLDVVKYFIAAQNCDLNSRGQYGLTPLHHASEGGHTDIIQYLITELGCDLNTPTNNGAFPIHMAFLGGHMDTIQYLINEHGCDPMISSKPPHSVCRCIGGHLNGTKCIGSDSGLTPLHYAAEGGHLKIIQYLIGELGCDSNAKSSHGNLPLHRACLGGCLNVIKYFIEKHKFNPCIRGQQGRTPLHYAASGGHMDIIQYLITELGCDPTTPDNNGGLPLHMACLNGHLNATRYFLKFCCPTHRDLNGLTLLHYASENGQLNIINYLITELGCDPNIQSNNGILPLHLACHQGHLNVAKYFIKEPMIYHRTYQDPNQILLQYLFSEMHRDLSTLSNISSLLNDATNYSLKEQKLQNCDPNSQSKNGCTPLHYAAERGHMNIIQYLITELGCVSTPNNDGDLPLHIASLNGHLKATKYFMNERNCDPNSQNKNGSTPLHCAFQGGHMNIIQYLVDEVGCDSSVVDYDGRNILHLASYFGHPKLVEWLLHTGKFDIWSTDKSGKTCLDLAGLKNENRYEMLGLFDPFVEYSKEFPIHTYSKTVFAGNSAAGKTTLTKVITERAKTNLIIKWLSYGNVEKVEPDSAGIVMSQIQSNEAGKMVMYDLAGQAEYHSSHSAVMETVMHQSPATFINVVDLSNTDDGIIQQLHYWLNFIDSVTSRTENKSCLIVVGSHSDKLNETEELNKKSILINKFVKRRVKSQELVGIVIMDCRNINSTNTRSFIDLLHGSHQAIAARSPSMSYYCHLLYAFFKSKPETAICTLHYLTHLLSIEESCLIRTDQLFLSELLTALNDKGMIIFLKNQEKLDASWIVVDIEAVLKEINGILFAPEDFLIHCEISNNTGIVCSSALQRQFPQYNIEMLIGFLQTLDLCHVVDLSGITTNLHSIGQLNDEKNLLLFFPCFLRCKPDFSANEECFTFGWCLCCREPDYQFFTSRFLHVLLLRLVGMSTSTATGDKIDTAASLKHERACDVWNNGISWDNEEGITTVVELADCNRRVVVLMSKSKETRRMKYVKHRNSVIRLIVDLQRELCPNMQNTHQYLISHILFRDMPMADSYPPDSALFPIENVARSMFLDNPYIFSCINKFDQRFSTKNVLKHEPYHHLRISSVCELLDSSKADEPVSQSLLDEVTIICKTQQLEQQTHSSLRKCIDNLSIFAGTNPITVSKLDRRTILAAEREHSVDEKIVIDLSNIPNGQIAEVHLVKLMIALKPIVEWVTLGDCLGLKVHSLRRIEEEQRGKIERCKREMLVHWLESSKNTTKEHLHKSLLEYKLLTPTSIAIDVVFSRRTAFVQPALEPSVPLTRKLLSVISSQIVNENKAQKQEATKNEVSSSSHNPTVQQVNYTARRSQRNFPTWSWYIFIVYFAVGAAVSVSVAQMFNNYYEALSKQVNVPSCCELIVYENKPTASGQELLLLPWILVFLIYVLYCFRK